MICREFGVPYPGDRMWLEEFDPGEFAINLLSLYEPGAGRSRMNALERDAVLSDCGTYRYLLRRAWDHSKPRAMIVMLNPSTADAEIDDPTIRSCLRLLRAIGYGSFEVVNLFGLRCTNPDALANSVNPVGPRNDTMIEAAVMRCDVGICAWGAHPIAGNRSGAVLNLIRAHRPATYCLGKTKAGAPRHPLYIKGGTALELYRA
jgi:hypothetical protein